MLAEETILGVVKSRMVDVTVTLLVGATEFVLLACMVLLLGLPPTVISAWLIWKARLLLSIKLEMAMQPLPVRLLLPSITLLHQLLQLLQARL